MRVTKTTQVTIIGVLTVTATPSPSAGYVNTDVYVNVAWTPAPSADYDITVQWGDGTTTTAASQGSPKQVGPKRYMSPGTYNIKAIVDEPVYGYHGEATAAFQVVAQLAAALTASPATGQAPLAVTFTMGISDGYIPYTWALNPGDGSTPYTGSRPAVGNWTQTHTYTKAGTFTATLTVTDAMGATAVKKAVARTDLVAPEVPGAAAIIIPLVAGLALLKVSR